MELNLKNFKIPIKVPSSAISEADKVDDFSSPLASVEAAFSTPSTPGYQQNNHCTLPTPSPTAAPSNSLKRKLEPCEVLFFGRDKSYPSELNDILQPLCCNLCNSKFTSVKTGKMHYESKVHYKRIKNWLSDWAAKNGEGPPKIPKIFKDGPVGPNAFHCQACDLPLTSLQHASQHYNGKRHKMVIGNRSNPSGSGYYDPEGKWVRVATNVVANDQRFGIGTGFQAMPDNIASNPPPPPPPASLPAPTDSAAEESQTQLDPGSNRHCSVCKIWVTSDLQMDMHLKGMKHAKKLKSHKQPPYAAPGDTVLATVTNPKTTTTTANSDVSMYRTPSGCFYCKSCNITVTDESVLMQHLGSKKHAKNTKSDKPAV